MLVQAGSGAMTLGSPSSPGVPKDFTKHTILLPYNNTEMLEKAMNKYQDQIAAVIVEPIAGNMGVVPPQKGFLKTIRRLCTKNGSVLIFDEVITGFRVKYGSVQDIFGVKADLTCLGKIIGGGFPIGACGGKARLMNKLAPTGQVYQAGTLSGNPVCVAAGIATLKLLKSKALYSGLERAGTCNRETLRRHPGGFNRTGRGAYRKPNRLYVHRVLQSRSCDRLRFSGQVGHRDVRQVPSGYVERGRLSATLPV
jgi:glutamate-1-semialdehyde 2,1-aminomutase